MQHQRRAELLIVNLRWLALLAVAVLLDEGESRIVLAAIPLSLFLYNFVAFHICSYPELYQRYSFWPGYVARALDLLAITFMAMRLGSSENAIYMLYGLIIAGAGFVYGTLTALITCAAALGLFYAAGVLSKASIASGIPGLAQLVIFPVSVVVGIYLSREFEEEWNRRESYKRLEGIYQLGTSFNERLDTNQIMHKTVQTALDLTYADRCVMTLYIPNSQQVERQAAMTRPGANLTASRERGSAIVTEFQSQVEASSTSSEIMDSVENPTQPAARLETPLSVGTKIVGKLEVESWDPEIKLGENEAQLLTILATQAAIAIQNARMVEDLQCQAETDPLTGLLNRRTLSRRISYEVQKAIDGNYPLSVWIFDLDNFKAINDNYGHPMGDVVLQEVANILRKTTRDGDFSVRYGGDEFLIVFRNADIQNALLAANRIKKTLEHLPIKLGENMQVMVKLSGGLSCTSVDGFDADGLVSHADDRLLRAKHRGKDTICSPKQSSQTKRKPMEEHS